MTDQLTSPTSMLWAYKLRRDNAELHNRINGLESQNTALQNQVNTYITDMVVLTARMEALEAARKEHDDDRKTIAALLHKVTALEKRLWTTVEGSSQATTIDEGPGSRGTATVRKTIPIRDGPTEEDQILQRKINTLQQEKMSSRQYVELAESVLQTAATAQELIIVKAFVFGIAGEKQRKSTEDCMAKKGWTWEVAKEAFEEEEKPAPAKRKAPKRYIIPPDEAKRMRMEGIIF